jgi:hypothetical protein
MLGRVVVENGVKKIVPLTADCGSGNPVGTVIAVYSNKVPNGYLPCNGVAFDTAQFPVLYALLGDDHTPDLRECTLKGIGESGRTVGAHIKAGGLAVGEFIDDRVQDFRLRTTEGAGGDGDRLAMGNVNGSQATPRIYTLSTNMRNGATTEVKAVGVNWCIKATSGINENQADNVLSALSPVDVVALNNVHSVTSNAVAQAFGTWETLLNTTGAIVMGLVQNGVKYLFFHFEGYVATSSGVNLFTLPSNFRTTKETQRFYFFYDYPSTKFSFGNILTNGKVMIYGAGNFENTAIYGDSFLLLL